MSEQSKDLADEHPEKITLYRSYLSEVPGLVAFIISSVAAIYLSIKYPNSIQRVPVKINDDFTLNLIIPLFAIVPVVLFGYLTHALCNFRYTIGLDFVTETEGLVSSHKIDRRVEFDFIRGVEIDRSLLGRIFNVGDLRIGSAMSSDVELSLSGIKDPSYWRDIILARMRRWEACLVKRTGINPLKGTDE